jgi:hypothetical protein
MTYILDTYPVKYPDKAFQKGYSILVLTKRIYATWISEGFPDSDIVRAKYSFDETFLEQYISYMFARKFVPDWNYLYKNLSEGELRIFERSYLKKEKSNKFSKNWMREDLSAHLVKRLGGLCVKDWKNHLLIHEKNNKK